ncbi:MAG TPA: FAD-dependent oxidoreductase [Patescibacteria group bacterium]|nr:FAD-dependent oxidoreductase [Patescibacteria group bacterium]
MYDTIILGGGPAGVSAGVYAARKQMKTLLITKHFGGQSITSPEIYNWIGTKVISGVDLAKNLEEHMRAQEGVDIKDGEEVVKVEKSDGGFKVVTDVNSYESKTVLICNGAGRRKLNVAGEREFDGRGVAYCSTCDAPMFRGKAVAVVGCGNAGLEAARDLLPYAKEVYIFTNSDQIKGDPVTLAKIKQAPNFQGVVYNTNIKEILGDKMVSGLKYQDTKTGEEKTLAVQGIFIEIGSLPNSGAVADLVALNGQGEIIIDHRTGTTSVPGVFAAGDITDSAYKQSNIAVGDAAKATLSAYQYLQGKAN